MEPRRVPLRHRVCMVITVCIFKGRFTPLFCIPAFPHLVLNYFFLHLLSIPLLPVCGQFPALSLFDFSIRSGSTSVSVSFSFTFFFIKFPDSSFLFSIPSSATVLFASTIVLLFPFHPSPSLYYFFAFSLYSYCLHIFCFPFRDLPVRIILTFHLHFPFVHFFSLPSCYLLYSLSFPHIFFFFFFGLLTNFSTFVSSDSSASPPPEYLPQVPIFSAPVSPFFLSVNQQVGTILISLI
jgi:hypothetical protein